MTVEEALGLVEEIKNCSLPWDDAHWEALDIVINYVKDKLNNSDKSISEFDIQPQPKQEWSEENKSYLLDFTRWFEQKAKAYDINLPMRGFDICAFCKEIIERLRICENLVWENIEETQRTNAIIMLKEGARRVYTKDSIDKCVDWLKSLRPQSQWKPSDMELEVLRLAAEKDGTCLMGLYEQLKKLREE